MTRTPSPKLLPWLAKKAGIDSRRAEVLWREACRYAKQRSEIDSSAYYKLAIDRLVELIAAESLDADAASCGLRPWVRTQRRVMSATVQFMEITTLLAARGWQQLGNRSEFGR